MSDLTGTIFPMTRVAAIDCGTNSIRLLIAEQDPNTGALVDVLRRMEVVRLGQDVDRTGVLAPDALARTLDMTAQYGEDIAEHGVEKIRYVATSAARDAANGQDLVDGVLGVLGVEPQTLRGQEEALLSFQGATAASVSALPGPYLVVDLGGGSTELVLGSGQPDYSHSMDVGCVRITERHLKSDPPTAEQLAAARADVQSAIAQAAQVVPLGQTATLVGLAGTITTVTAHALGLEKYDPARIDGAVLDVDEVLRTCEDFIGQDRATRASLGFMHPGRVDVIAGGSIVWAEVVRAVRAAVGQNGGELRTTVTSEHDILDGIALSLFN